MDSGKAYLKDQQKEHVQISGIHEVVTSLPKSPAASTEEKRVSLMDNLRIYLHPLSYLKLRTQRTVNTGNGFGLRSNSLHVK